jgi:hypothetical protein
VSLSLSSSVFTLWDDSFSPFPLHCFLPLFHTFPDASFHSFFGGFPLAPSSFSHLPPSMLLFSYFTTYLSRQFHPHLFCRFTDATT